MKTPTVRREPFFEKHCVRGLSDDGCGSHTVAIRLGRQAPRRLDTVTRRHRDDTSTQPLNLDHSITSSSNLRRVNQTRSVLVPFSSLHAEPLIFATRTAFDIPRAHARTPIRHTHAGKPFRVFIGLISVAPRAVGIVLSDRASVICLRSYTCHPPST